MKRKILYHIISAAILFSTTFAVGQNGLAFRGKQKKDKISFTFVNNLVIIPVEVNGAKLSFLLDTGVNATMLFGITEADSLRVNDAKPIKIRGFGEGEGVIALKSENNLLKVGDAIDEHHSVYVIFEESLNFSARMGIPIHGIIGYDFFKNFIVTTDYQSRRIKFELPTEEKQKNCYNCEAFNISFYNNKPYVNIKMNTVQNEQRDITLLIDSGSSDALWLFDEDLGISENSDRYFEDFLGLGFSGNIFGKRSKISQINIGQFVFNNVKVAFPEKLATQNVKFYEERDGSIGGDILKRFTVTMDYIHGKMILKKNRNFSSPFYYNMAGITLEHDGVDVVTELKTRSNFNFRAPSDGTGQSQSITDVSVFTEVALVPRYVIVEVREGSPAHEAGLLIGDEITKINGLASYNMKLFDLNALFSSKEGKRISLEVKRHEKVFKVKFTLKKVL